MEIKNMNELEIDVFFFIVISISKDLN